MQATFGGISSKLSKCTLQHWRCCYNTLHFAAELQVKHDSRVNVLNNIFRILVLLSLATSAYTETVLDLYDTRSLVTAQSADARAVAAREGLTGVLVKVSGRETVGEHPDIQKALSNAQNYVLQFSYESTDERIENSAGQSAAATVLFLKFSPQAVEGLLRKAALPLWPANRPGVLVWLVADDVARGRYTVNEAPVNEQISKAARRRGIPLVKPLFDLQDQIAVDPQGLWRMDQEMIRAASERYGADAILVGRYTKFSNGQWRADWTLMHKNNSLVFESDSASQDRMLANGVNQAADYFAAQFAILPREKGSRRVFVEVNDVGQFSSYTRVLEYLQTLKLVRRADLLAVEQDKLLFALDLEGVQSQLLDTIALGRVLQNQPGSSNTDVANSAHLAPGRELNPLQFRRYSQ